MPDVPGHALVDDLGIIHWRSLRSSEITPPRSWNNRRVYGADCDFLDPRGPVLGGGPYKLSELWMWPRSGQGRADVTCLRCLAVITGRKT